MAIVPADLRAQPRPAHREDGATARAGGAGRARTPQSARRAATDPAQPVAPADPGAKTVTIIDGTSGKRQEVVIGSRPDEQVARRTSALTEPSRHGPLPEDRTGRRAPVRSLRPPGQGHSEQAERAAGRDRGRPGSASAPARTSDAHHASCRGR